MILNARDGKPLPVYGDGQNVRDWLYVEDHCDGDRHRAARRAAREKPTTSAVGMRSRTWRSCETICDLVDEMAPRAGGSRRELITFVKDRPGHDRRYAMDARKIERELGWRPKETFESGIRKTIRWYLENEAVGAGRDQRKLPAVDCDALFQLVARTRAERNRSI